MGALGYTMQLPEEEKYLVSKEELLNQITVMLGGRAAEEEVFNLISTGASNDIERASQTARSMVTVYGMTESFDMMALESIQNRYLDGRAVRNCSEETSTLVDKEILKIIRECHEKARTLLRENRDLLDKISEYLLEKETIYGDEFMKFVHEKYPELKKDKKEDNEIAVEADNNTLVEEIIAKDEVTAEVIGKASNVVNDDAEIEGTELDEATVTVDDEETK
jgi:cell division protease FtsH